MVPTLGVKLPLTRVRPGASTEITGAPYFRATAEGVLVATRSTLSLLSSDLQHLVWRLVVPSTSSGLHESTGTVLYGPCGTDSRSELLSVRLSDGRCLLKAPTKPGVMVGATDGTVLVQTLERPDFDVLCLAGDRLREIWRRPSHPGAAAVSAGERYLAPTALGLSLECLDAENGELLWQFEPPGTNPALKPIDRPNRMGPGFPSVAVAGDRVIVTTLEPRVYALALESGEVLGAGVPPCGGAYQVTDTSVFFAEPFGLSEFDHREMKEVDRIEYREEVAPLYGRKRPSLYGVAVTEDSVVWTTAHGAFMGVSRVAEGTQRRTWTDTIPGAIMPIARSPVAFGGHIYYVVNSLGDENVSGLYAYASAPDGK